MTIDALADGDEANPGSDLEVVARQAQQRAFFETERAARDLATARGIEIVPDPIFG